LEREYWKVIEHMDSNSFRELMLTYGQDVWNFAYFLTKSKDLADDISQDVFLRAYRKIGSFRGESSIRTWLFTITRNISVNYRRTAFIRKVILVGGIIHKETAPSAEKEALEQFLSDELWKIVMSLPIKFREVIVLNAKYELSQKEIAQLLGLSEGTVKSRLSRARQKLSEAWKEEIVHERA
jgi:RNA polymerase sigma-70 factor (ECF subfamily)